MSPSSLLSVYVIFALTFLSHSCPLPYPTPHHPSPILSVCLYSLHPILPPRSPPPPRSCGPSLSGVDESPRLIFMAEISWNVCGGAGAGGAMGRVCLCWLGVEGVQGVHEASLSYQRHSRLLCPNGNYTAHNWHSLFGSQQGEKNGWRDEEEGH